MELTGINQSLKDGCRIHAFRSGGGLRVIRIEKNDEVKGYGEHPQVEDALSHADEDFLAGHRPYKEVYGGSKPHYLTGSSTPTSSLDGWLLQGHTFDVWRNGKGVTFQLKGLTQVEIPEEISARVLKTGRPEEWENRGFTYRIVKSKFPSGESCVSCKVVKSPEDEKADSWMYWITKTGHGSDFWDAMNNAFEAEEVEIKEE